MKQYLMILFFLNFWTLVAAQDWAPVREGETYHYRWYPSYNSSVQYPRVGEPFFSPNLVASLPIEADEFSIRVDGLTIHGVDSQYQYQKRFGICGNCPVLAIEEMLEGDSVSLFPKIIQKVSGGYRIIYNKDTLELTNNLQIIPSANPLYYYATTTDWVDIYSNPYSYVPNNSPVYDSVVYIYVDDLMGQSLYLMGISKNNGLIYFLSDYVKWGIIGIERSGNNSGVETFGFAFEDIYGFNVGDQFYYHSYTYRGSGVATWPYITNYIQFWYRWKILDRQNIGTDTINYTIERVYYDQDYPVFQNLGIADTFIKVYIHSEDSFYTMTDLELRCDPYGSTCVGCKDLFAINGNHMRYIGYDFNLTSQQNGQDDYISMFYSNNTNYYEGAITPFEDFATLYQKGLGRVYEGQWSMESADTRELIGYIKGTDTIGSTPNITIYTDTKKALKGEQVIKLLANPTNDYLKVYYQSKEIKYHLNFSILNRMGQTLVLYEGIEAPDNIYTFPVHDLASGLYFLEIRQDGKLLETQQFVKE